MEEFHSHDFFPDLVYRLSKRDKCLREIMDDPGAISAEFVQRTIESISMDGCRRTDLIILFGKRFSDGITLGSACALLSKRQQASLKMHLLCKNDIDYVTDGVNVLHRII